MSDGDVERDGGRKEVFEIRENEDLIGCELAQIKHPNPNFTDFFFGGVKWIKIKWDHSCED